MYTKYTMFHDKKKEKMIFQSKESEVKYLSIDSFET
jgi:hypothetical protein